MKTKIKILKLLMQLAMTYPNSRIGQIISDAMYAAMPKGADVYYISDSELLHGLEAMIGEDK